MQINTNTSEWKIMFHWKNKLCITKNNLLQTYCISCLRKIKYTSFFYSIVLYFSCKIHSKLILTHLLPMWNGLNYQHIEDPSHLWIMHEPSITHLGYSWPIPFFKQHFFLRIVLIQSKAGHGYFYTFSIFY